MQPANQAVQADYRGKRHARLTKSMTALASSPLKVLCELRYMLADGQTGMISNALLARRTGLSEGYISPCVRWLAGETIPYMPQFKRPIPRPFIERQKADGPGYAITMLPPPELRTHASAPPVPSPCPQLDSAQLNFFGDLQHDPQPDSEPSAPLSGESPETGDHAGDPPIFLIHAIDQEEEESSTSLQKKTADSDLYQHLMQYPGMNISLARKIADSPVGTVQDFVADYTLAKNTPRITNPLYLVAARWRDGQRFEYPEACDVGPDGAPGRVSSGRSGGTGSGGRGRHRPGASGGNTAGYRRRAPADPSDRYAQWSEEYAALGADGEDTHAA